MLVIDKQNNITLTRGDTAYIDIDNFIDYDGNTYYLQEGDRMFFRLRTTKQLLTKEMVVDWENNIATLIIEPRDTIPLPVAAHRYEIELVTIDDEHFTFVANKIFTIDKEQEVHNNGN